MSLQVGSLRIAAIQGRVSVTRAGPAASQSLPAVSGMTLDPGDVLETGPDGLAALDLQDGSRVEISSGTRLQVLEFRGSPQQLLRLLLGRIRVFIQRIAGSPNPYELSTPIATIGVRGTIFDVQVNPDTVTTVDVYEGRLVVANAQLGLPGISVGEGQRTIVYPLRAPSVPQPFEAVPGEALARENALEALTEELLEPTERVAVARFLAFPDMHLDSRENPAYAAKSSLPSVRIYLQSSLGLGALYPDAVPATPARSPLAAKSNGLADRSFNDVSPMISYLFPFAGFVGGVQYEFLRSHDAVKYLPTPPAVPPLTATGASRIEPNVDADTSRHRLALLGSRRNGSNLWGVSYELLASDSALQTEFERRAGSQLLENERSAAESQVRVQSLTLGYLRNDPGEAHSLGLFAGAAMRSANSQQTHLVVDGRPSDPGNFKSTGWSTETGFQYRRRLRHWISAGATASWFYSSLNERIRGLKISDSDERTHVSRPSAAVGLGFRWRDQQALALDYEWSSVREKSWRHEVATGRLLEDEADRRMDHSLHVWLHQAPTRRLYLGTGGTWIFSRETLAAAFQPDVLGRLLNTQGRPQPASVWLRSWRFPGQLNASVGYRVHPCCVMEYLISKTVSSAFRPLQHRVLLRFNRN